VRNVAIARCLPACRRLAIKPVEGDALALERHHNVHGGHGLAARVLGVDHGVADQVLEEHLEHRARLLVDEAGDALHTTTASEAADGGLAEALDAVAQHLAVAHGALAEALAALAASGFLGCAPAAGGFAYFGSSVAGGRGLSNGVVGGAEAVQFAVDCRHGGSPSHDAQGNLMLLKYYIVIFLSYSRSLTRLRGREEAKPTLSLHTL
jgi:hypothetical protein